LCMCLQSQDMHDEAALMRRTCAAYIKTVCLEKQQISGPRPELARKQRESSAERRKESLVERESSAVRD